MTGPSTRAERVSKTAVLAGAALAFPLSAKADIVYSGIQNFPVSITGTDPYTLKIDGSANDFTFTAGADGGDDTVLPSMVGSNTNAYVSEGAGSDVPDPLLFGDAIGSAQDYSTGIGTLQETFPFEGSGPLTQKGPWPSDPNGVAYLGVEFYIGTDLYYGWVGLSACTPDATNTCDPGNSTIVIQDWAYQSTLGSGITAGEGEIPEPSTLALFALGAVGLAALRARRKRAA